jgi:hypothetical protein
VNQWYLQSTEQDHDIDAPEAWNLQRGHANAIIGLMDTGVQYDHPDLAANIWTNQAEMDGTPNYDDDGNGYIDDFHGWDFIVYEMTYPGEDGRYTDNSPTDFVGHGTHVAGIAAGVLNNSTGVSGIAGGGSGYEGVRIMPLRIGWMGADGHGYVAMDYAAQAIEYGRQKGVAVFSCAWTSSYHSALAAAVNHAINDGIIFCVAAGNSNSSTPYYLNSRGDCIDIAATDGNDVRTSSSNFGTWVDISAPGQNIYSTFSNHYTNTYAYMSGTSMASAMVTGAVALLKSHRPEWTRAQIMPALLAGADDVSEENPDYVGLLGAGRLNLYLALLNAGSYTILSPNGGETWTVGDSATISWASNHMEGGIVLSLWRDFPHGDWQEIYVGTPESDFWSFRVTGPPTQSARVRIQSQQSPSVSDSSDADFTISVGPEDPLAHVFLDTPNGGERVEIGNPCRISWESLGAVGTVSISINRDFPNGEWQEILSHVEDDGAAEWQVMGPATAHARLRIVSDEVPSAQDSSDGDFFISFRKCMPFPIITVLSPNGGEVWYTGQRKQIKWSCEGNCDSVAIQLCRGDTDEPCSTIVETRNDGLQSWVVSGPSTPKARIRVACLEFKGSDDISDAPFTIVGVPEISAHLSGNDIILRWKATGAPSYRIYSSLEVSEASMHYEATTPDTFYMDAGAAAARSVKFYQVRSATVSP